MSRPINDGVKLDVIPPGSLPWPHEVLIVVAARRGTENRAAMEGVIDAICRRCGAGLAADTRTVRTAHDLPQRRGRAIEFFCVECCLLHRRSDLSAVLDQRGGRNEWIPAEPKFTEETQ